MLSNMYGEIKGCTYYGETSMFARVSFRKI